MDYNEIKEIKNKSSNLTSRLNMLEELHKETTEKIKSIQDSCAHDLIFINSKYWNKAYEYLQYGKCLVCGKNITLSPDNICLDTNKLIDSKQIIDETDDIELWDIECDCSKKTRELQEAQKIFDNIINNDCSLRFKEAAKHEIITAIKNMKLTKKKK